MRRHPTRPLWLAALVVTAVTAPLATADALPPAAIFPVEGFLRTPGNGAVADGKYTLTVRVYTAMGAKSALWTAVLIEVPVTAGHFFAVLGEEGVGEPIPAGLFSKHPNAAIGVQVSTEPELPRRLLHAVPYAMHAATAEALAGGLGGQLIEPGSVPDTALAFSYASSDSKAGPALALKCTGCITADHIAKGAVDAKKVAFQSGLPTDNVQDALGPLVQALRVTGSQVGVGKAPGNICAFDVATDSGEACLNGTPALWTRFAESQVAMDKLGQNGQLVYRSDQHIAWMRVNGIWRRIAFAPWCGDGQLEGSEECDDGPANADIADKCRANCLKPFCGDVIVDSDEQCDDGKVAATGACPACKTAFCGDGHIQAGVEICDDGNQDANDSCTTACKPAVCGDGIIQTGVETCDDGDLNADAPDKCRKNCKKPACGDGIQDTAEQCDNGGQNADTADKCRTNCKNPICGDGIKDGAEACDDGNQEDGDACTNDCKTNFSQGCAIKEAEHPSYTTPARDVVLCGNKYTAGNIASACAAGWGVCTLTQWNTRYPKGQYPNGTLSSWGAQQSARYCNFWNAGAPSDGQKWCCNVASCNNGYNPWNSGKYLYNDAKNQVLKGSGSCCSWDSTFSSNSSGNMAVYCCRD